MLRGSSLKSRLSAAILLISSATLLAVEPWVDPTASWPVGQPGGIHSKGDFHITPDFTFVGVRLLVIQTAPARNFREFVLPPHQIQFNGNTGT